MKLGILQIDLDLAIFQKTAIGILNYRSSLLCSGLSGFSLSSVFWLIYCTATTSAVLFIAQPRRQQYYSVNL